MNIFCYRFIQEMFMEHLLRARHKVPKTQTCSTGVQGTETKIPFPASAAFIDTGHLQLLPIPIVLGDPQI